MQTFLDRLSGYIYDNFSTNLDEICLVVPNRRASLFLKKGLADQAKKIIWSPQIFSIEDFINKYAGLNLIDPLYLQCELYNIHVEREKGNAQSFIEFLKWGQVLLGDFNEVDMYLVESVQLFSYLTETKALSLWNPDQTKLTDFQLKYLRFYNSLGDYHQKLSKKLLEKKQVYAGLAFRYLAENIELKSSELKYHKIIFAGFNALTKAEEKIISYLKDRGLAEIIWDADAYYVDDEIQEAGKFIRNYQKKTSPGQINWIGNYLNVDEKEINLIGVPQQVGQAKVTGQILEQFSSKQNDLHKTAVVLNDQSLIEPLLNSIPESIKEYNLTMGLSLKNSAMFRLIKLMIELQINALKFKKAESGDIQYYYRDIFNVMEHPYIRLILKDLKFDDVNKSILELNKTFLTYGEIFEQYFSNIEQFRPLCKALFKPWNDCPENGLKQITEVIDMLKVYLTEPSSSVEYRDNNPDLIIEYLFQFSKILNKLKKLIADHSYLDNILVFRDLFMNVVASISLPFYGEPLQGLQVMGMLETRNLDFERLIMLSVNDDFIPSGSSPNSFVPFEIKRDFKLPTYRERNAVFAYHFYRILQRSKQIYLLYNTESGELGGGDKSRFILQIQNELAKRNPSIRIKEKILTVPVERSFTENQININKSAQILDILSGYLSKGCSASALNTYRNCSLQFYFKYILGIRETTMVEETIETSTLGTVIHDVLKKLYEPLKRKVMLASDIKNMTHMVQKLIIESFAENYLGGDLNHGKNLLIVKVANIYIQKFLKKETIFISNLDNKGVDLLIEDVENKFMSSLNLNIGNKNHTIVLKGIFDRVDKVEDMVRIIDYKTGKVEQRELKFNDWNDLVNDTKLDKCFQLLFYSLIYAKSNSIDASNITPGIISLRNLSGGFMSIGLPDKEPLSDGAIVQFEDVLKDIFLEILNPEIDFKQTIEAENCKYCTFKSICNRN